MAREASIDHARIFCVVVREDARGGQENREQHSENGQTKTGGPKTFQDADAQTLAPSGWNSIVSQVGTARKAGEEVAELRNGHIGKRGRFFGGEGSGHGGRGVTRSTYSR